MSWELWLVKKCRWRCWCGNYWSDCDASRLFIILRGMSILLLSWFLFSVTVTKMFLLVASSELWSKDTVSSVRIAAARLLFLFSIRWCWHPYLCRFLLFQSAEIFCRRFSVMSRSRWSRLTFFLVVRLVSWFVNSCYTLNLNPREKYGSKLYLERLEDKRTLDTKDVRKVYRVEIACRFVKRTKLSN